MKTIPTKIDFTFNALLIKKGVPQPAHFHYKKWLRYYLDFCFKYQHDPANRESFAPFVQKLKDKSQSERQREQAFNAVSIYYQIEKKKTYHNDIQILKNKSETISTKKPDLKSTNADWRPVYNGLNSEIKFRHRNPNHP